MKIVLRPKTQDLSFIVVEILSFATSHYAIGMQLVMVYNYFDHVCNYKFGSV